MAMNCPDNSRLRLPLEQTCANDMNIGCMPQTDGKPTYTPASDQLPFAVDSRTKDLWFYDCGSSDWYSMSLTLCGTLEPTDISALTNLCNTLNVPVLYDVAGRCVEGTATLQEFADALVECIPKICESPNTGNLSVGDEVVVCNGDTTEKKTYRAPCDSPNTGNIATGDEIITCNNGEPERKTYRAPCDSPATGDMQDGDTMLACGPSGTERKTYHSPCSAPSSGELQDSDSVLVCGENGLVQRTYEAPCAAMNTGILEDGAELLVCENDTLVHKTYESPKPCESPEGGDLETGDAVLVCSEDGDLYRKSFVPLDPCTTPDGGTLAEDDSIIVCRDGDLLKVTTLPYEGQEPCSTRVRGEDNGPIIVTEAESCGDCCEYVVSLECPDEDSDQVEFTESGDVMVSDEAVWVCDASGRPIRKRLAVPVPEAPDPPDPSCPPEGTDMYVHVLESDNRWLQTDEAITVCDANGNPIRRQLILPNFWELCIDNVDTGSLTQEIFGEACIYVHDIGGPCTIVIQNRDNAILEGADCIAGSIDGMIGLGQIHIENPFPCRSLVIAKAKMAMYCLTPDNIGHTFPLDAIGTTGVLTENPNEPRPTWWSPLWESSHGFLRDSNTVLDTNPAVNDYKIAATLPLIIWRGILDPGAAIDLYLNTWTTIVMNSPIDLVAYHVSMSIQYEIIRGVRS